MSRPLRPARPLAAAAAAAAVALAALGAAGLAAAQPGAGPPPPPLELDLVPMPPLELVTGPALATDHVRRHDVAIAACLDRGRARVVRTMRVSLRWTAAGAIRAVNVGGGSAAFNRCAAAALRGRLAVAPGRPGSAWVTARVNRQPRAVAPPARPTPPTIPAPPPPPLPSPSPPPARPPVTTAPDLHRCTVDADCTIHFRTSACIAQDPIAVNKHDPAAVRAAYPVRRIECAMGGPQYQELLLANQGRYAAACEQARCVVKDAGPRPTRPGVSR